MSVLGMVLTVLAVTGQAPAQAAQTTGEDVPAWSNGWSWTYATTFRYVGDGTDVTLNENVTYTVAGVETFEGQEAYRLNISGSITGGSGRVETPDISTDLSNFSGSVSGYRLIRRSDLALLEEHQDQHLKASARVIVNIGVTADIDLTMTPKRGWRTHAFPLNAGDRWKLDEAIDYTGGFSYSAGSLASGSSDFDGTLPFDAEPTVANASVGAPGGDITAKRITAVAADGQTRDTHWWSAAYKNDARNVLELPLDGAKLTLTRQLSAASLPGAANLTAELDDSLTCAGDQVTVSGRLSTGASGATVNVTLDKSQHTKGQKVSVNTTTTSGGNYSATLTAPSQSDGLSKSNGSTNRRGSWGVTVTSGTARGATTLVVTPQNCSTLEYTGDTSAAKGTNAEVSAKLTDLTGGSAAGKQINFALSGGQTVAATTNSSGVATATLPVTGTPRDAQLTVSYAGTPQLAAATDTASFTVGKIATTTGVTANPTLVTIGDDTVFTASVTAAHGSDKPVGRVQFQVDGADFGAPIPLSDGSANSAPYNTGSLSIGEHRVNAVYLGNADFAGSTSPDTTFRVRTPPLATTTTSTIPSSAVFGEPVELRANVSTSTGTPTGTVTFSDADGEIATVPVDDNGYAVAAISDLAVGAHTVVATYSGDEAYDTSSATGKNLTVSKATATVELTASTTETVSGEQVSYSVAVDADAPSEAEPTGTVQLVVDGEPSGDPVQLEGGLASFPAVSLGAGKHTVAVEYSGSAGFQGGSDSLTQQVAQADTVTNLMVAPSPSNDGDMVSITAHVSAVAPGSGAPTGTVRFTADGELIGSVPLAVTPDGAVAVLEYEGLALGTHEIVASYPGDDDYRASASEVVQHEVVEGPPVRGTEMTLTSSKNPSTYGELITFTADVDVVEADDDGTAPVGAVQFSMDGTNLGGPVPVDADGIAVSPSVAAPESGDHTVIATFLGEQGFTTSGEQITQLVSNAQVDVTLQSSAARSDYGDPVRFTATVASQQVGTGTPAGTVQFRVDGQPLGDAVELENGVATSPPVADLTPGGHEIIALYGGNNRFDPLQVSLVQSVNLIGTSTTLAVDRTSTSFGSPVTLTATVTPEHTGLGQPAGTVRFLDGDTVLATVPVAPGEGATGVARTGVATLTSGDHAIRAVYFGSDVFEGSSSGSSDVPVAKLVTSMTAEPAVVKLFPLGLPLGRLEVTLSDGNGPLAGAPVTFRVGAQAVCTTVTDASGVASCNAFSHLLGLVLSGGYTASYAGDANHQPVSARGVILK